MQSDGVDQAEDLRLRRAQANRPAADPEAPGEHGQVEHDRRIGEDEFAEVDDDVGLRADSAG
jgi:hypothetical protein